MSCTVSGLVVTVNYGETSNLPSDNTNILILKSILNPSVEGGTGNFRLETFQGQTSLDNNDRFHTLGFIAAPGTLASAIIACESNCKTGELGNYSVTISHSADVKKDSVVAIAFSSQLGLLDYIPCSSVELPEISCDIDANNNVKVFGFSSDLKANTSYKFLFTEVTNPSYVLTLDLFNIDILNSKTNNILLRASGLTAPIIQANDISGFSVCPDSNNATCTNSFKYQGNGLKYEYLVSATTTNNVP